MNGPSIIGLCGGIGAGKDAVANYLEAAAGYIKLQFAYKLKETALRVFEPLGLEPRHVFGTQSDKAEPIPTIIDAAGVPRTGRSLLQWLGTEGFRSIDPDVWVKYAMARHVDPDPGKQFVFSDVRFLNEFAAIRDRGGVIWEVTKVGGPDHTEQEWARHTSEEAWRKEPKDGHLVARFGDLQALYDATDMLLNQASQL